MTFRLPSHPVLQKQLLALLSVPQNGAGSRPTLLHLHARALRRPLRRAASSQSAIDHEHHQRVHAVAQPTNLKDLIAGAVSPKTLQQSSPAGFKQQQQQSGAEEVYVLYPPLESWRDVPELMAGCEPGRAPLRVAVLLSGGVDSSLALNLVKAAGHHVTAFYLQIWFQEDFRNFWGECPWEEDLRYCKDVCERAGVPLQVVPLTQQYWDRVVSYSIAEIRAGRTPNPDVLCNSRVKFGAFYEHLEQQHSGEFDRVASGHYARLLRPPPPPPPSTSALSHEHAQQQQQQQHGAHLSESNPGEGWRADAPGGRAAAASQEKGRHEGREEEKEERKRRGGGEGKVGEGEEEVRLALTPDAIKDQTYFLAHLSQQQLRRVMFPLGCLTKAQVRGLADVADLPNKARKDSQGICFLGKVKFSEFVKEHLGEWPGLILEQETGEPLGYHKGVWYHTLGQRRGIPLHGGPWYVTRKDVDTNTLWVSCEYHDGGKRRDAFRCVAFNWTGGAAVPKVLLEASAAAKRRRCQEEERQQRLQADDANGSGSGSASGGGAVGSGGSSSGSGVSNREGQQQHQGQGQRRVGEGAPPAGLQVKVRHGPMLYDVTSFEFEDGSEGEEEDDYEVGHAQTRSQPSEPDPLAATLHRPPPPPPGILASSSSASVTIGVDDQGLAPGQYAVFYFNGECLGSAVMLEQPQHWQG